jgi:hypothetical protein
MAFHLEQSLIRFMPRCDSLMRIASASSLATDRRGTAALFIGFLAPVFIGVLALGVEVASWEAATVSVQRAASLSAVAGAINFNSTGDLQKASMAAAQVAQLNGAAGAAAPTWNATTKTLTSNKISVSAVSGFQNSSDTALRVTIAQDRPVGMAGYLTFLTQVTIPGTATAELNTKNDGCVLALQTGTTGVTMTGTSSLNSPNCAVISDGSMSFNGNTGVTASAFIASGSITGGGNLVGTQITNAPNTSDPYATNSSVQNAIAGLVPGDGSSVHTKNGDNITIDPGTYSDFLLSGGTLNLNPGRYVVNGNITLNGSSALIGSGVTIVVSGSISVGGSATMTLSAAGASATNGAIPAMLFIGTSSSSLTIGGTVGSTFTGVLYFPNASISFSGTPTPTASGSDGCLELIGATVSFNGTVQASSNCQSLGAAAITNNKLNAVALVQ